MAFCQAAAKSAVAGIFTYSLATQANAGKRSLAIPGVDTILNELSTHSWKSSLLSGCSRSRTNFRTTNRFHESAFLLLSRSQHLWRKNHKTLTTNKANPTNAQYSVILFVPFVLCLVKPFLVRSWFRDSGRFDAFLDASRAKSVIPERRASENETIGNPEVHL